MVWKAKSQQGHFDIKYHYLHAPSIQMYCLHAEGWTLFCCIPAEGLTFDLVVAFQRGLSCCSTTASTPLTLLLCYRGTMYVELV